MSSKLQQVGLVVSGLIAGVLVSLNFSAVASKDSAASALPIEELRSFADVYNAIKQGYVEPVEDKKLITHAISGMLANLDPHSAYLDADAFKDLQVSTQGEFAASASKSAWKTASSRWYRRSRTPRPSAPASSRAI
jgi:carboxyl-terminal processing protease